MLKITVHSCDSFSKDVEDTIAKKIHLRLMPKLEPNGNFFIVFNPNLSNLHHQKTWPIDNGPVEYVASKLKNRIVIEFGCLDLLDTILKHAGPVVYLEQIHEYQFKAIEQSLCAMKGIEKELMHICKDVQIVGRV